MRTEMIKALRVLLGFFIILSVVVFLGNILQLVIENTKDPATIILSYCAFCFIVIMFVYKWLDDTPISLFKFKGAKND